MARKQVIASEVIVKAMAEATRAAIQAMATAMAERPQNMAGPKIGINAMKQPTFNWEAEDKYSKTQNIQVRGKWYISNIQYTSGRTASSGTHWLGRKVLKFIESLASEEKDTCSTLEGLFKILTNKFRLQFNETIISLQFCKLSRQDGENAEEWIGRLRLSTIECNYKEIDRQIKEQFIHGLNDNDMLGEIILELTKIKDNEEIMSKNVLSWTKRIKAQRVQSTIRNSFTEAKKFNKIKVTKNAYKDSPRRQTQTKMPAKQTCGYCCSSHPPRQCLAYGKTCTECSKIGCHFRMVCRSRKTRAVNVVEQEAVQYSAGEHSIDLVSINSIQFSKYCLVLTANLKMSAGRIV